jgi:FixJ family two-component response regulator
VIDDDPSLLRALLRLLLAATFTVLVFDSAEAFLATKIAASIV